MGKFTSTPGPWDINYEPNLKQIEIFQPNKVGGRFQGRQIAVLRNAAPALEYEVEANARLIAAAPDAIEACQFALILLRGSGFTDNTPTIQKLKAVLEKAGV